MKTESNQIPAPVAVTPLPLGNAEVTLTENIHEIHREGHEGQETMYAYDEYRIVVPARENLISQVTADLEEWLNLGRSTERTESVYAQIDRLKAHLDATDYKAHKFVDGAISEAEYSAIRRQRQEWRDEINRLEAQLEEAIV